jgi:signal transduction histidine kinase
VRSAHYQNKLALRNQVPEYLAHLVAALSKTIDRTQARKIWDKKISTRLGKSHGEERAFSFEYTMDQLILEYHILRQVICDVLEEDEILTPIEREVIVCSIEQAVNDSATQFSESVKDMTAKAAQEIEFKALVQTRDDFLSVVAHELRTPMTSLQLQAEMLLKNQGEVNEANTRKIYDFANQVNKQVKRLNILVNDIIDFGRIRSGDYELDFEIINICSVVSETIDQLDPVFQAFKISPPEFIWNEDAFVRIDKYRIHQVLSSLLTNAVKYGRGQPISIEVKVLDKFVEVTVTDKGIGIEPFDVERIFSRFERAVSSNEVTGLGLGLYITKEIINAHGGKIWAQSEFGKGSTFCFLLPKVVP